MTRDPRSTPLRAPRLAGVAIAIFACCLLPMRAGAQAPADADGATDPDGAAASDEAEGDGSESPEPGAGSDTEGSVGGGAESEEAGAEGEGEDPDGVGAAAEPAEDPSFEEARRRFEQGVALARAGDCRGALAELNASLALLPRPSTIYNIAQCEEELHRYDLAVVSYEAYLELAPEDDPERAAVTATMRALANLLGTIAVSVNTPAEVWLGDRVVGQAPGDVLVPGGRHVLELRADGFLSERREVEVAARSTVELEVELRSAEESITIEQNTTVERPPLPSGVFFGGVALSAITFAVAGYFGVSALTLSDRERSRDTRLPATIDEIDEAALLADVFFVTGGVLTAATILVAFLTDWGDEPEPDEEAEAEDGEAVAPTEEARVRVSPLGVGVQW